MLRPILRRAHILYLSLFSPCLFLLEISRNQSGQKQIPSAHNPILPRSNLVKSKCQADNIKNSNQIPKPLRQLTCMRFHRSQDSACPKAKANLTDQEYIKESWQIWDVAANSLVRALITTGVPLEEHSLKLSGRVGGVGMGCPFPDFLSWLSAGK